MICSAVAILQFEKVTNCCQVIFCMAVLISCESMIEKWWVSEQVEQEVKFKSGKWSKIGEIHKT